MSALTADYCKKMLLEPRLTATVIYRHKRNYLEDNMMDTLHPFNKTTAIVSLQGTALCPNPLARFTALDMNSLLVRGLCSNQKVARSPNRNGTRARSTTEQVGDPLASVTLVC